MKLRRITALALAAAAALALTTSQLAAAAPSSSTPKPIHCGMVVNTDANLYLARDLRCATFGVRVDSQETNQTTTYPHVKIDLRGHTLRGTSTQDGITAINSPPEVARMVGPSAVTAAA